MWSGGKKEKQNTLLLPCPPGCLLCQRKNAQKGRACSIFVPKKEIFSRATRICARRHLKRKPDKFAQFLRRPKRIDTKFQAKHFSIVFMKIKLQY